MSRSRRRYRAGLALVSGLIAMFGLIPAGLAVAVSADPGQAVEVDPGGTGGNEWCC